VNKAFNFEGAAAMTASDVGIDRFLGTNLTTAFNPTTDPTTGQVSTQYQRLVYDSIKQLYYSNYLSSSYGDSVNTASIFPGSNTTGDVLVGNTPSDGRYFNYLQTTLSGSRYFSTASNAQIQVLSIPSQMYGDYINPNSFTYKYNIGSDVTLYDNGEGLVYKSGSTDYCGIINYYHGLIILTSSSLTTNFTSSNNVTCSFQSSRTIYETQYKCTIRPEEFNFSLNPSLISGSTEGTVYSFVTGSYFSPYVTTVGFYNEAQELLMVAKLGQPLPTSRTTDTTILVNIDK
jgi:hypothetical protein